MVWEYERATIKGDKANPRPGDSVTVVLTNGDEAIELTWVYDGDMTKKQFVEMIRRQVRNRLEELNAQKPEEDVTAEFDPAG